MAAIVCVSGLSPVSADHQLPYDETYRFTCGPSDHASADRASGHIRVHAEISGQEPAPDGREIGCASITFLEGGFDVVPGGEYEVTARLRIEAGEWAPRTEIEPRTPAVLLSNEEAESRISVGMTPIAYGCWTDEDCANGDGPYSHDIVRCQPYPWCEDSDTLSSPPQVGREFTMTSRRVVMNSDYPIARLDVIFRLSVRAERVGPPYSVMARAGATLAEISVRRLA